MATPMDGSVAPAVKRDRDGHQHRSPLRHPTRSCTMANGPQGLSGQRHACTTSEGGFVGCSPAGSEVWRPATANSNLACTTTAWGTSPCPGGRRQPG